MRAHVCQDDYGLWFVTLEYDDGQLVLLAHATTRQSCIDETEDQTSDVIIEPEHMLWPEGGIVSDDYTAPEPRRAVNA
jgi:hypothetical protein